MRRPVRVRPSYIADLVEALPLRFLDFLEQVQPSIIEEAATSFTGSPPSAVDPAFDIIEIRGHWESGDCDYFATIQLLPHGHVDLIAIDFDLHPLRPPGSE